MQLKWRSWATGFSILAVVGAGLWCWRMQRGRQTPLVGPKPAAPAAAPGATRTAQAGPRSWRLSNSPETAAALEREPRAIVLRNALIDTRRPVALDIPQELRGTNGRLFIVQAGHALDQGFYNALAGTGAKFISYIPNNAALVEGSAQELAALGTNVAVVPYEPYYKLDSETLAASVNHIAVTNALSVVTPPGSEEQALAEIRSMGWALLGRDRTPFGPEFVVQIPGGEAGIAAAQWPLAQEVEMYHRRQPLNDLTRVRLGVATNTVTLTNYYGLTGQGIWMNLDDTGVDGTHPDLHGRVFGVTTDDNGHGTHVAGIIAGNGFESSTLAQPPNVPSGSSTNASYRGEAEKANIWSQVIDSILGPLVPNEYLQTNASANLLKLAQANGSALTNGFISNDSWGTIDTAYDLTAASF